MKSGGEGPKFMAYQIVQRRIGPLSPSVMPGICNEQGGGMVYCGSKWEQRLLRAEAGSGAEALAALSQKLKDVCGGTNSSCKPLGKPQVEALVVPAIGLAKLLGDYIHRWVK
ncbi:MAG: hypothetical protein HY609_03575 [Deltaproteobacteria bacterium]|nr:hypothetical protein [Deltaproteobacteria bacterium]